MLTVRQRSGHAELARILHMLLPSALPEDFVTLNHVHDVQEQLPCGRQLR